MIDFFPVAVCRNGRIRVCKLLKGKAYHGYNEAKKAYVYGFKVQVITTADKQPVDYFITAGSFHDSPALQAMQVDWPAGSERYGDSGNTDYEQEDLYRTGEPAECDQIYLSTPYGLMKAGMYSLKRPFANPLRLFSARSPICFRVRFMPSLPRASC